MSDTTLWESFGSGSGSKVHRQRFRYWHKLIGLWGCFVLRVYLTFYQIEESTACLCRLGGRQAEHGAAFMYLYFYIAILLVN